MKPGWKTTEMWAAILGVPFLFGATHKMAPAPAPPVPVSPVDWKWENPQSKAAPDNLVSPVVPDPGTQLGPVPNPAEFGNQMQETAEAVRVASEAFKDAVVKMTAFIAYVMGLMSYIKSRNSQKVEQIRVQGMNYQPQAQPQGQPQGQSQAQPQAPENAS